MFTGQFEFNLLLNSCAICCTAVPPDLKGANHASSMTVPLQRRPAAIPPTFMQFSGINFGLAVTQMHSFGAGLIGKQNCPMFTKLGTNTHKKTGKL